MARMWHQLEASATEYEVGETEKAAVDADVFAKPDVEFVSEPGRSGIVGMTEQPRLPAGEPC